MSSISDPSISDSSIGNPAATAIHPAAGLPPTRPDRLRGLAVVVAGLIVTGGGAAIVHRFGTPDGTWAGEVGTESVAAALGYLVAFGLGWWRPRRSPDAHTAAARSSLVLALVGALLVPICFWNPMPLTFAASALLLIRWGRDAGDAGDARASRPARSNRSLELGVRVLCTAVLVAQAVAFVVHVIQTSTN
jgi:hypothetical protein